MERKTELKRNALKTVSLSLLKLNAACQHVHYKKNYLTKQQIMPSAECCKQNHMNTRLFDLSFYSTADFFIHLHRYVSENFHFKRKIQRFVAPGRSEMISLQDFSCLHCWYSYLFIACVLVLSLSLSPFIFFLCLSTYSTSYT